MSSGIEIDKEWPPRAVSQHISALHFGDRVLIDGDKSLVGTVTAFTFRRDGYATVEVSWIHNGSSQSAWFEHWRLTVHT